MLLFWIQSQKSIQTFSHKVLWFFISGLLQNFEAQFSFKSYPFNTDSRNNPANISLKPIDLILLLKILIVSHMPLLNAGIINLKLDEASSVGMSY